MWSGEGIKVEAAGEDAEKGERRVMGAKSRHLRSTSIAGR